MFDQQLYLLQNPWKTGRELKFEWIARDIVKQISPWMEHDEIIVLTGSRQVGKTTIIKFLIRKLLNQQINPQNIFYFSPDDEGIYSLFESTSLFISFLQDEGKTGKQYIFIDEIQRLENAGLFLKTIYDLNLDLKIIVSGSSSLEIRSKIAEHLTGRKINFFVYPFSFSEYLRSRKIDYTAKISGWSSPKELEYLNSIFGSSLNELCEKYMILGGYPKVVLEKSFYEKEEQLRELYKTYIEKDVGHFFGIRDTINFNKFVLTLSYQNGALFNVHAMSRDLGIYREKLVTYLSILENTFIIKQIAPFYNNKAKEISKMPKVYFQDNGIRNYCLRDLSSFPRGDAGALAEGFCLSELLKMGIDSKFWRTQAGAEVDFIIQGKYPIPLEVKFTTFRKTKVEKGFVNFISQNKVPRAFVITKNFSGYDKINQTGIWFVPIYLIGGIRNLLT